MECLICRRSYRRLSPHVRAKHPDQQYVRIVLDADYDLRAARLPADPAAVARFERNYARALREYAREHGIVANLILDSYGEDDGGTELERFIWQEIHDRTAARTGASR